MEDLRLHAPAALRNRDPILDILQAHLPAAGLILEVASGSGEHCIRFGEKLPTHVIQPSDPDPRAQDSINAWIAASGLGNIRAALDLDASAQAWPLTNAAAVICINMAHISPWAATQGLCSGAARILPPGGPLFLYGPFKRGGAHTSKGNSDFDRDLRQRNPEWGIRDLEQIGELAVAQGFSDPLVFEMPANNLTLLFRKLSLSR
jgi:SAM-dependent methyltransferase